ncbi:MAG: cytochrome c biogenesis protein CcdA [Planctomycetaceae bacterium]|nr:cytochrome c biogenesis protein CcdA [Planctomycetaceae bacterium]
MRFSRLRSLLTSTCFLILVGFAPGLAVAQVDLGDFLPSKKPLRTKTPKAEFTAKLTPETVRPGDEVTLSITAKLPEGFYIYGTDGKYQTRITAKAVGAAEVSAEFVPDHVGKTLFDPALEAKVTKFVEGVTWTKSFRVDQDAAAVRISGKLEGQYCSTDPESGRCIQILPAYQFDLTAKLSETTIPTSPSEVVVRPSRKSTRGDLSDPIEYCFRLEPGAAGKGDTVTLTVQARLDDGWHTYSLTQRGAGGEPTDIHVDSLHNLEPLGEGFVADRPFVLEETDVAKLETHYGEVSWSREFRVTAEHAGDYGVAGALTYAVCDENSCKPVNSFPFAVGVVPAEAPSDVDEPASPFAEVVDANDNRNPDVAEGAGQRAADETRAFLDGVAVGNANQGQDRALLPFLLLCIGGGFLALLTPCSFPMVPITVSFFLKQSEQNHRRPWLLALVYCGSIVAAFTVLGVGISAIFGATKLNELANNPWVNLVIAGVFVAFGLNMLGAFEIRVPTSLLTWSSMHEGGGSYLGAVFMALTFTLTSFTCTFAVAGTLLVSAAQGDVYWPVIGMLAFGTAFASPFFVLALLPGLLKKLPKSGGWMNSVKVVMALIEIGAAVKFFSVADLAWNPQPLLFDFVTVMLIWLVLSLAIGAYLLGWYRFSHDTPVDSISPARGFLAMTFFGLALMLGYLTLQPERADGLLMDQIIAFAPPRLSAGETELGPTINHHGIMFALDLERARPVAEQRQRPLFLDFTGVNCVNCRRMEKKMQLPENKERMGRFVNVQLYTDKVPAITNPAQAELILAKNLDLQVNWFGDVSLPSYVVTTPDGKQILAAYVGYEQQDGEFTRFLDYGMKKWEKLQANGGQPAPVNLVDR